MITGGAALAAFAYFYFVAKTSANAQKLPGLAQAYNLGYNLGQGTGFSISSPVAS